MRAMVIDSPRHVSMRTGDAPEPGDGQVRIRLQGCGVCGSNLPVWEGQPWFAYPFPPGAPGHEGWGVIDAIGPGVDGLSPGTRVAALSTHAYADCDLASADAVVPIPDALAGRRLPGEALACAVNVVRRASLVAGTRVAVVGVGFLGAAIVRLATRSGVLVTAISRRRFALQTASGQGAAELVALDDVPRAIAQAQTLSGRDGYDVVIEAAGTQAALDVAAALVKERGRLVIAGYHQDGPRQVDMQSWNWRGIDVINAHEREERVYVDGMRAAVALAAAGEWDPWSLITHALPLAELDRALTLLSTRPDGFLKAVVVP